MRIKNCKPSGKVQGKLLEFFVAGTTARTAASILGIHRNSAVRFFRKLREEIAKKQEERSEKFFGRVGIDESYFGGVRKGKRGQGAAGKIPVFGLLKRGGKVYAQIIQKTNAESLIPIIREKV
ncbi:MAG: transposase, partial [Holosporaceae bacterium]|nr:transposase [Holosporaceae bacterium]